MVRGKQVGTYITGEPIRDWKALLCQEVIQKALLCISHEEEQHNIMLESVELREEKA